MPVMTKDKDWLRGRARVLCEEMRTLGVTVAVDSAQEVLALSRDAIAGARGLSRVGARGLFTDDFVRRLALPFAESCTTAMRAELATTLGRRVTEVAGASAVMGLLETVVLDLAEDDTWTAKDRVVLALTVLNAMRARLSVEQSFVVPGHAVLALHDALRDGAARVRSGETVWEGPQAAALSAFLTRLSNNLLAADEQAPEPT